jgi:hypothetical protein
MFGRQSRKGVMTPPTENTYPLFESYIPKSCRRSPSLTHRSAPQLCSLSRSVAVVVPPFAPNLSSQLRLPTDSAAALHWRSQSLPPSAEPRGRLPSPPPHQVQTAGTFSAPDHYSRILASDTSADPAKIQVSIFPSEKWYSGTSGVWADLGHSSLNLPITGAQP